MSRAGWHRRPERGSLLGIRITAWFYRHGAHSIARALLVPIVGYFFLTDRTGRRASRAYLERLYATPLGASALAAPPSWRHVWSHYLEFGRTILDRVGFWLGEHDDFELSLKGAELLEEVANSGRGALILGAHLGSFDAMRLLASLRSPISVGVLMHTANAEKINAMFEQLGREADLKVRVIPVQPGSVSHVFEVRSRIQRGEVVTLLADRSHPHEEDRVASVHFLGADASFPQSPMLLAASLRCPVLMMVGLRVGERRYEIHVERFAERVEIPRVERDAAAQQYCQDYADRLARYCAMAPYQWFNFYDFWLPRGEHVQR